MGLLKNIVNAKISGNVGSMNFRRRGSDVVVAERSYTNKSKGSGASEGQRLQRCRLGNIVTFFKVIKAIEARAWEDKIGFQSDFNMFTKKNLASSPVFLSKSEVAAGASVIADYVVSEGSLKPLAQSYVNGSFNLGIVVTKSMSISAATVSDLSKAIIANNDDFENGDKITLAILNDNLVNVAGVTIPMASCVYFEFTLDENDTTALSNLTNFSKMKFSVDSDGKCLAGITSDAAFAIHSRKVDGALATSTQSIIRNTDTSIYSQYTSDKQKEIAKDSYGYQSDVLLTPGITIDGTAVAAGTVSSIKYGDDILADGATIESGQTLTIEGTGLSTSNVTVSVGGVSYVPVTKSTTMQTFTLSTAGVMHIYINGTLKYTVTITQKETDQTITKVILGSTSYGTQVNNYNPSPSFAQTIEVDGTNLGTLTATGATLTNVGGSVTARTAQINFPSTENTSFTILCGGIVVVAGSTTANAGGADYE